MKGEPADRAPIGSQTGGIALRLRQIEALSQPGLSFGVISLQDALSKPGPGQSSNLRAGPFGVARKTLAPGRRAGRRRTALIAKLRDEVAAESLTPPTSAHEALHAALEHLVPLDREIIRLIHWEGFSQEDAARIVGKPAGTIRSRYSRARATLRARLDRVSSIDTETQPQREPRHWAGIGDR